MSTELKKLLEKGQGLIFLFYIFRLIKERKRQVKERRPGRERGESSKQLNHDEPSTTDLLSRERSAEVLGLIIKSNKIWMDLQVHHIVMGLLENKKPWLSAEWTEGNRTKATNEVGVWKCALCL